MDERYALIDVKGKGLVIFSAYVPPTRSHRAGTHSDADVPISRSCSHAGIINVVRDAIDKFKRPVHMVRSLSIL